MITRLIQRRLIQRLIERWWPPYLREELRMLRTDLGREQRKADRVWSSATSEVESLQALVDKWIRDYKREYRLRVDAETTLALVVEELRTLRDDIARQEQAETEANTAVMAWFGLGVAIYPPYTRGQAEAIQDHARDKRADDGLGD